MKMMKTTKTKMKKKKVAKNKSSDPNLQNPKISTRFFKWSTLPIFMGHRLWLIVYDSFYAHHLVMHCTAEQ